MELDEKYRFVLDVLFAGLTNRNIGFDSSLIPHVSPEDFQIVLDRCEETGAGICGIEIFDFSRWEKYHRVDFLDVVIRPEEGLDWARRLVRQYADQPNISVCATFYSPEDVEAHQGNPDWHKQYVDLEEALGGGVRVHKCSEPQEMIASREMRDQGPHNDAE
ncbi:MAG: hypothetical protein WCE63_18575 [Acidobacteriaceae bacterium]